MGGHCPSCTSATGDRRHLGEAQRARTSSQSAPAAAGSHRRHSPGESASECGGPITFNTSYELTHSLTPVLQLSVISCKHAHVFWEPTPSRHVVAINKRALSAVKFFRIRSLVSILSLGRVLFSSVSLVGGKSHL